MTKPILIIGGGVIGLSIGWHIVKKGHPCILFEKNKVGLEASSAAAGMITPASEVRFGEGELLKLFLQSLEDYPQFIKEIEAISGSSTDFRQTGSLMLAIDPDDEAELLRLHDYQKQLGLKVHLLTHAEVMKKEPHLSTHFTNAVESLEECFLDNVALIQSLKKAFITQGGILFENRPIDSLVIEKNRAIGVRVGQEIFKGAHVVLATGSDLDIENLPLPHLPIRPVKGQALEVKLPDSVRLSHAVRTLHRYPVYLVPRSDGRLTIGATLEDIGKNEDQTAGALLDLIYGAWKILPAVYEAPVTRTWIGFRPTARDTSPIIGPSSLEGLSYAMGMYRHGILLTPLIGKLMSDWICEEKDSAFFKEFGYKRFE